MRKNYNFFPNTIYALNLTPWKARQIRRFTKELSGIKIKSFRKYRENMKNVLVWGKITNSYKKITEYGYLYFSGGRLCKICWPWW